MPCDADKFYNTVTKVCELITPGKSAIHPMFALEKCLYGQYSSAASIALLGKTDCQPCDEGYFCKSAAIIANDSANGGDCPNGYWCSNVDENT